jgi:tRNA threonylcarbamoyladenosine biosynthesis protein TsaE
MMRAMCVELPSRRATSELARRLAPALAGGDLVILSGPLGSGKTYFTRALCRSLGLPAAMRVPSPTFTLMNEYPTDPPLCHADVYRLSSAGEVAALGLDSQRDEGRLLVVEWGEPYAELLGGDALIVEFSVDPRQATLATTGARSRRILEQLEL